MRLPVNRTQTFVLAAILCGAALALSLVDSAVSSLIPMLPGFKLGLANIVSLFALYHLGLSWTLLICVARCILTAFFSGNLTMFLFSIAGGIVSILLMFLLIKRLSIVKVSVLGGVSHNIMQVLIAILITATPQVACYLPALIVAGAISGFFMGVLCKLIFQKLNLPSKIY